MPKLKGTSLHVEPIRDEAIPDEKWPRIGQYYKDWTDVPSDWQNAPTTDLTILSVDPGDENVGVAVGWAGSGRPAVKFTTIMSPRDFRGWFRSGIGCFDFVACERFKLRKDMALKLVGSEFPTVQIIGWLKGTVEDWNDDYTKRVGSAAYGYSEIQFEQAQATILDGIAAVMQHEKIPQLSPGKRLGTTAHTNDALSAELHWWFHVVKFGWAPGVKLANLPKS